MFIKFTTEDDYTVSIFLQGVYDVKNKTLSKSFHLTNYNNPALSWDVYHSFEDAKAILDKHGFTQKQLEEIIDWYVDKKIPEDWMNAYPNISYTLDNLGEFKTLPYNTYNQTPNLQYYKMSLDDPKYLYNSTPNP